MNSELFLAIYNIGCSKGIFDEDSVHFRKVSRYFSSEKKKESMISLDFLESLLLSIPSSIDGVLAVKKIAKSLRVFDLGAVGYYLYTCENIIDAIKSYACFGILVSDFIDYDIYVENDKISWQARYDKTNEMMSEIAFKLFMTLEIYMRHSLVCKLLGRETDGIIRGNKLIYHFEGNNLFLTSANSKLNKEMERIFVDLLLEKENIIDLVKIFFKRNLSYEKISIEKLAIFLNMSNRSVQRYLKKENTSYKELLTEVRKELVEIYLTQKIPVKKIAFRLGYYDVSSFLRAFRGWHGCTTQKFVTLTS